MNKRILFVDDDPLVLQGLQRMLRPMRHQWHMEFVDGGEAALARLEESPFDVVVSDMRMPGMNGAQLLEEVMKHHPRTLRLILSGHADRNLILDCVGAAHQYLVKPCQPDDLKLAIARAAAFEPCLESETLRRTAARLDRLPSLPSLYFDIVEACRNPEAGVDDVAAIVARDIGMAAKILKLANSAFFGLARPVADIQQAVAYLGLENIKAMVLTLHTFSLFEGKPIRGFSLEQLWAHSFETGNAARAIALAEHADRKIVDETFVAGLLHDTGKLILANAFPDQFEAVMLAARQPGVQAFEVEAATFGASHGEIGGYLLGLWGLPAPVVEAVVFHHRPSRSAWREFAPLTAVHVADALLTRAADNDLGSSPSPVDSEYLRACSLDHRLADWSDAVEALRTPDTGAVSDRSPESGPPRASLARPSGDRGEFVPFPDAPPRLTAFPEAL